MHLVKFIQCNDDRLTGLADLLFNVGILIGEFITLQQPHHQIHILKRVRGRLVQVTVQRSFAAGMNTGRIDEHHLSFALGPNTHHLMASGLSFAAGDRQLLTNQMVH